jgi:hypothetical protein
VIWIKIPNYQVRRNGRGFWEPTSKMRALGFQSIPCGRDGPEAWATAREWNERWQRVRRGEDPAPARLLEEVNLSPERGEELTVYPIGSLGEAYRRYRRTPEWARKAPAPARIGGEAGGGSSRSSATLTRAPSR